MTSFNIAFEYLKKADFATVSSVIFNILADNMEKKLLLQKTQEKRTISVGMKV